MAGCKYLVFDAANTLIHKPKVWEVWENVLANNGEIIDPYELRKVHKLISESIRFPDRTSAQFYKDFNAKVLYAFGIVPGDQLLEELFLSLKNLPWEAFEDVEHLSEIQLPLIVASNFRSELEGILGSLVSVKFQELIVSENIGHRKPEKEFYQHLIDKLGVPPQDLIYIGDSLELDVVPASQLGIRSFLIDREGFYPNFKNRISSFAELTLLLKS